MHFSRISHQLLGREFIFNTLTSYELSCADLETNFVALIGDNCSTNRKLADLFYRPLIGCNSHRFNLGVERFLSSNSAQEMAKVVSVMTHSRNLKAAGRLRLKTHLKPIQRNITRWTGAIAVLSGYQNSNSYRRGVSPRN